MADADVSDAENEVNIWFFNFLTFKSKMEFKISLFDVYINDIFNTRGEC